MKKVEDLQFDCSNWDEEGNITTRATGIIFDGCVKGEDFFTVEVKEFLDEELAEACGTDINTIKEEIYMDNVTPLPQINVNYYKKNRGLDIY